MGKTRVKAPVRLSAQASPSIELLAGEQGVHPIRDLDELSSLWPDESDPDLLMEFIKRERKARRAIESNNGNR